MTDGQIAVSREMPTALLLHLPPSLCTLPDQEVHAIWTGNLFLQLVLGAACMHIINHYSYL